MRRSRGVVHPAAFAADSADLVALVGRQLVRPDAPRLAGQDAFRFAHALVRQVAYDGIPKAVRAARHERLARWLAERADAPDEVVGHHLERAYRYRTELRPTDAAADGLAAEASARLAAAAAGAQARARTELLERAVDLHRGDEAALAALETELGAALFAAGRVDDAARVLAAAVSRARAVRDARLTARAQIEQELVRLQTEAADEQPPADLDALLRTLARHGDELGQCRGRRAQAMRAWIAGRYGSADDAWRHAAEHAAGGRRAGAVRHPRAGGRRRPCSAPRRCRPRSSAARRSCTRSQTAASRARSRSYCSPRCTRCAASWATARTLAAEANATSPNLGRLQSAVSHHEALIEMLAERPEAAEQRLREGDQALVETGERSLLATTAAMCAQAVYAQGRYGDAWEWCRG